ncbi:MAG: aldehyde dehydrogenase family protein [Gemmatimonadaceae bacterium]|nr:aldehyde dehydrogenase family protein [Gemmatimonadaceae bacterium]
MGPIISAPQRALIMEQLQEAVAQGARVVAQQEPHLVPAPAADSTDRMSDRQVPAVVLAGVTTAMRVWQEETFGPVLAVTCARDRGRRHRVGRKWHALRG